MFQFTVHFPIWTDSTNVNKEVNVGDGGCIQL